MLILFVLFFLAWVIFLVFFFMNLPDDLKKQSIRPALLMVLILGFWFATLPSYLAPESNIAVSYAPYNVITSVGTVAYPLHVDTVATASIPVQTYNAFFYIWLIILVLMFFLLLFWYLMLLRARAQQAMSEGSDTLQNLERRFKR